MPYRPLLNRQVVAWALYDWGNSAFALSTLAVLFPLFLGSYWSAGDPGASVTSRLAWTTAAASLVVVLLAPVLGAISDTGAYRKRFLVVFAVLGAVTTAALSLVGHGEWPLALALFALASVGFFSANTFYDSLIVDVTTPRYYSLVSALGFSLGYIGSASLLALHVWLLSDPARFGFAGAEEVMRFTFVSVGLWWIVFLLPLAFLVREDRRTRASGLDSVRAAYRALAQTFSEVRRYRNVFVFLLAYWLYIAGVFTVIAMAVNFGQRLGFGQTDLVMAILITNFIGFPATLAYGVLGHRIGAKSAIYLGIAVYFAVACWAVFLEDVAQFYAMAIVIGLVQGGVQGMSRSLYAALIPPGQSGEFFGFYNMLSKLANVLGPALVGIGTLLSDDPKAILVTLMPLFVAGALLLRGVRGDTHAGLVSGGEPGDRVG